jgi:hypothetical protein
MLCTARSTARITRQSGGVYHDPKIVLGFATVDANWQATALVALHARILAAPGDAVMVRSKPPPLSHPLRNLPSI